MLWIGSSELAKEVAVGPIEDRRALTDTRDELERVRDALAVKTESSDRKSKRYRIAAVLGAAVLVALAVLVGVGTVLIVKVNHAVSEINERGKENRPILTNIQAILDEVRSVTSETARQAQSAGTAKLVTDLECFIAQGVQHSDRSLPLPAGCLPLP